MKAILPSSFAMICTTVFLAESLNAVDASFLRATLAISFASLWGWPFAAAFAIPYYLYKSAGYLTRPSWSASSLWLKGVALSLAVLVHSFPCFALDFL